MSENDVVVWSKNSFLKWSDFKAEPHHGTFEDAHSIIKYRFTWTVNSEQVKDKIMFFIENLQIFVEFHPVLSWVRSSQKGEQLLKHEQGHFDLAELVKRENEEKIYSEFYEKRYSTRGQNEEQRKQFAKEDSSKMIAQEIEKFEQYLDQRRQDYDTQTEYGQNLEKQREFDKIFDELRL